MDKKRITTATQALEACIEGKALKEDAKTVRRAFTAEDIAKKLPLVDAKVVARTLSTLATEGAIVREVWGKVKLYTTHAEKDRAREAERAEMDAEALKEAGSHEELLNRVKNNMGRMAEDVITWAKEGQRPYALDHVNYQLNKAWTTLSEYMGAHHKTKPTLVVDDGE